MNTLPSKMNAISIDSILFGSLVYMAFMLLVLIIHDKSEKQPIKRKKMNSSRAKFSSDRDLYFKLPTFEGNRSHSLYTFYDFITKYRLIPRDKRNTKPDSSVLRNIQAKSRAISLVTEEADHTPTVLARYPTLPGCEPDGPAAAEMQRLFPKCGKLDVIRFLVARKGNVELAAEMMRKALEWRHANLPVKRSQVEAAVRSGCFLPKGEAKDGSPIIYFRWGMYDNQKAPAEAYILAAVHTIEHLVRDSRRHVNVTVVADLAMCPDGVNGNMDMHFIQTFAQVLSDVMPERLNKLIIYPFMWYGRAIWNFIKVFIDKRTQDKVVLLAESSSWGGSNGSRVPQEVSKYIYLEDIPVCCGGTNTDPPLDILSTFPPEDNMDKVSDSSSAFKPLSDPQLGGGSQHAIVDQSSSPYEISDR